MTGEGGDAAADLAITGTLVGTLFGRGSGVVAAEVGLTAERGAGGAELGLAGCKLRTEPEELGFGAELTFDVLDEGGAERGPGGLPPELGG